MIIDEYSSKRTQLADRINIVNADLQRYQHLLDSEKEKYDRLLHSVYEDKTEMRFIDVLQKERDSIELQQTRGNIAELNETIMHLNDSRVLLQQKLDDVIKKIHFNETQKEYQTLLSSYSKITNADDDLFAKLVVKAIGTRSMRQFADEIGYNVSSLSRIVNQKNKGQCSDAMLAAIAANAAEGSGVTIDLLMKALGREYKATVTSAGTTTQDAVVNYLFSRGYSISKQEYHAFDLPSGKYEFDFAISTGNNECQVWYFKSVCGCVIGKEKTIFNEFQTIVSLYYWGLLRKEKVSVIVDDADIYKAVVNQYKSYKAHNNISIILIENGTIKVEYVIGE